jgi:hypothetical protein
LTAETFPDITRLSQIGIENMNHSHAYFKKELGVRATVAWQSDSFGHTACCPLPNSTGTEGLNCAYKTGGAAQ